MRPGQRAPQPASACSRCWLLGMPFKQLHDLGITSCSASFVAGQRSWRRSSSCTAVAWRRTTQRRSPSVWPPRTGCQHACTRRAPCPCACPCRRVAHPPVSASVEQRRTLPPRRRPSPPPFRFPSRPAPGARFRLHVGATRLKTHQAVRRRSGRRWPSTSDPSLRAVGWRRAAWTTGPRAAAGRASRRSGWAERRRGEAPGQIYVQRDDADIHVEGEHATSRPDSVARSPSRRRAGPHSSSAWITAHIRGVNGTAELDRAVDRAPWCSTSSPRRRGRHGRRVELAQEVENVRLAPASGRAPSSWTSGCRAIVGTRASSNSLSTDDDDRSRARRRTLIHPLHRPRGDPARRSAGSVRAC